MTVQIRTVREPVQDAQDHSIEVLPKSSESFDAWLARLRQIKEGQTNDARHRLQS